MLNKKLLGSVSSLPSDANFENVSLLLSGDGTNGAQNNTFLDSSTNNFTITRNGNTTQGSFSPYGNLWSNFFPAGGNYPLTTPASSNTSLGSGDFTIEAWVFTTSVGSYYNFLVGKWEYPNKEWFLQYTASSISFYLSTDGLNDSATFTVSTTVPLNAWNHIAVTRSGSNLYIFLNGTLVSTQSITQTFYASTQVVSVGNFPFGGISDTGMRGYVSNVRLVKGTALYTSSFTPSTTPLTAVSGTQLLTCQSNRFLDNSSNGFAVTATSSNSVQRFSPFNPSAPYSTSVIGGSGYFAGNTNYLQLTSSDLLPTSSYTLEFFVYPTIVSGAGPSNTYSICSLGSGTSQSFSSGGIQYTMWITEDTINFGWYNGSSYTLIQSSTIYANQWFHVAVGFNGTTTRMWVNGVSIGTSTSSYGSVSPNTSFRISGDNASSVAECFKGWISSGRFVRSDLYGVSNTTITVPTAPLTAISNTQLLTNFTNAGIPDLAMQNNLETVGNAQVSTSVKKYGTGSLAFDGTGDYLTALNIPPVKLQTGDFTIECWAYFTSVSSGVILDKRNGSTRGILIYFGSSGMLSLAAGDSDSSAWEIRFDKSSITTSTWYHVAFVRSGNNFYGFVDGTQISASQSSSMTIDDVAANFYIGAFGDGSTGLSGNIDDLRISKFARYTANFTPPTAALPTF